MGDIDVLVISSTVRLLLCVKPSLILQLTKKGNVNTVTREATALKDNRMHRNTSVPANQGQLNKSGGANSNDIQVNIEVEDSHL